MTTPGKKRHRWADVVDKASPSPPSSLIRGIQKVKGPAGKFLPDPKKTFPEGRKPPNQRRRTAPIVGQPVHCISRQRPRPPASQRAYSVLVGCARDAAIQFGFFSIRVFSPSIVGNGSLHVGGTYAPHRVPAEAIGRTSRTIAPPTRMTPGPQASLPQRLTGPRKVRIPPLRPGGPDPGLPVRPSVLTPKAQPPIDE